MTLTYTNCTQAMIEQGILTREKLEKAESGDPATSVFYTLLKQELIDEQDFFNYYRDYTGLKTVNLKTIRVQEDAAKVLDADVLRRYFVFPIIKTKNLLTVGMVDPLDYQAREILELKAGMPIRPVLAKYSEVVEKLDEYFGVFISVKHIVDNLERADLRSISLGYFDHEIFQASTKAGPINKLLHLVISHALQEQASDIHFEPTDTELQCRFRIDGVLTKFLSFPKQLSAAIVSSIKVLAKMDIAEKRLPLDGGFQVKIDNRIIDLRVSSFPIVEGEKIVVRILDKSGMRFSLAGLGLRPEMLEAFVPLIHKNSGIMLVTGPTGSGKTTTLYAVLNQIKSIEKNIVTIEDPIEYHLDMINQSQVNVKAGLTFAKGLRSFLRQDPDILLVGEIRDQETAEIAFQAALTGHLVLSTLHTNDAVSSITRLRDMGIEPYLLSSSIIGVLAQRLVRRSCRFCLEPYEPEPAALRWLGIVPRAGEIFYHGRGCEQCKHTGYKGRVGVYELFVPDEEIRVSLHETTVNSDRLTQLAQARHMGTLRDDAAAKVREGLTTAEEAWRVLR